MTGLRVVDCGPGTTLQDRGRLGYRRFGVSTAGVMDRAASALANVLVGNSAAAPCVEFQLSGGRLSVEGGPVVVAVIGPGCAFKIGDRTIPEGRSALAEPGEIINVGPVRGGVYAYLALGGGIDAAPEMGSVSVHRRSGIGGQALVPGDLLPVAGSEQGQILAVPPMAASFSSIRLLRGPQDDHFSTDTLDLLCHSAFSVATDSDRMACRLSGPLLRHVGDANIVSDGVVPGSIQVPGDGAPIVLLRDCQTTGGYPKIATVISADLDRLAQIAPGGTVHFAAVTLAQAIAAARRADVELLQRLANVRPAVITPTTETLLGTNLIDGAVDGR